MTDYGTSVRDRNHVENVGVQCHSLRQFFHSVVHAAIF